MGNLYNTIIDLCKQKGITGGKMCTDLGISKGTLTDLKMGRQKSLSTGKAQMIAAYLGVSVDYLLGEKEKAPTENCERPISDEQLKFALWGNCQDIDETDLEDVRRYAAFVRERKKKK